MNAGHDVGIAAIAELAFSPGVELLETGGQDDRAHLQGDPALLHRVVDGVLLAGLRATIALRAKRAVKAPLGLRHRLLLAQSPFNLVEAAQPIGRRQFLGSGPGLFHQGSGRGQQLFGHRVYGALKTAAQQVLAGQIALDGFSRPFAGRDRIDHRRRAGRIVAAGEDALEEVCAVMGSTRKQPRSL